jgi:hypothetical protein
VVDLGHLRERLILRGDRHRGLGLASGFVVGGRSASSEHEESANANSGQ